MPGGGSGRRFPPPLPAARIVVVGASLAGLRTAEALRHQGFRGRLTIVGDEVHDPYDRPPLSKAVLAGTATAQELALPRLGDLDATWRLGTAAVRLDLPGRRVVLADGTSERYDGLVLATGARARLLPGAERVDGVHVLRSLDDALRLRAALERATGPVAVLGAGFIGSEVADAAVTLGRRVALVEAGPLPLLTALGPDIAGFVTDLHRRHGVDLHLSTRVVGLDTTSTDDEAPDPYLLHRQGWPWHSHPGPDRTRLRAVELDGGDGPPRTLPAELAVVGLGAVPNTEWLLDSGLRLDAGVLCDATLTALGPDGPVAGVVAAGDVARFPHPLFDDHLVRIEHWSNAVDQAKGAATTVLAALSGQDRAAPFAGVPSFWSDQYDRKILSVGLPHLATDSQVVDGDPATGRFLVGYGRAGRLVGAAAVGLPGRLAGYRRLISERAPWPPPSSDAASAAHTAPAPARAG